MADFVLRPVNFKGSSDYLRDELFKRNLFIPTDDEGKLIRAHAISLLQDWESNHPYDVKPRKCRVIFHHSMNPSAGPYVFASVNEKNFQAPYEKEVIVPEYMLRECIDRAVTTNIVYEEDEFGRTQTKEQKTPLYPYTMLGYVDEEESTTAEEETK